MTTRARQPSRPPPSPAMLALVRALARDAALKDYRRSHPEESCDEGGDLRPVFVRPAD